MPIRIHQINRIPCTIRIGADRVILFRQRVHRRETVEGRREVAGLEVVGGCRFVPFLAAVLVGALYLA